MSPEWPAWVLVEYFHVRLQTTGRYFAVTKILNTIQLSLCNKNIYFKEIPTFIIIKKNKI